MKQQKSGSTGDAQKQKVVTAAPAKVGARGMGSAKKMAAVRGGPRQQKSGSMGG